SGSQYKFENRIGWAVSFLTNVGALERPKRGHYTITDAGKQLIPMFPNGAKERDIRELGEDPASPIRPYQKTERKAAAISTTEDESEALTPTEQVQSGISRIQEEVAAELLTRLQGKEP